MNHRSMRLAALVASSAFVLGCGGASEISGESLGESEGLLSESKCPDSVPAILTPAADQKLSFTLLGDGVQIYQCRAVGASFAWTFVAPSANLLNPGGQVVGTHYAGPTWESVDGSTFQGAVIASASAPIAGAIPWLLLTAVDHDGQGRMSEVTGAQRLNTTGGVAPAGGCDAGHVGDLVNVPYAAEYFFYKTSPGNGDNAQCGG